jgi:hypothetical protein
MAEKNNEWTRFLKVIAVYSLITFIIAAYPLYKYTSGVQLYSIISGFVISLLNALLGFKLNVTAFEKSMKSFMVLVFGGLGIRVIIVILFLVILLQFSLFEPFSLIASVFFFYILFISIEIYFLHRKQLTLKTIKDKHSE